MQTRNYPISPTIPNRSIGNTPTRHQLPLELYFTARQGSQPAKVELYATLQIQGQTELANVPLGLTVSPDSLCPYGISERVDYEAHQAFGRIAAALFKLAATAVACGTSLNPGRLPVAIGLARADRFASSDLMSTYSAAIDMVKLLYTSATITARQKKTRLYAIQTLMDNARRLVLLD